MAESLFLTESRAKYSYRCACCDAAIPQGEQYFRHDPHPYARFYRGQQSSHWCVLCIGAAPTTQFRGPDGRQRLRVRVSLVRAPALIEPVRIELVGIGALLASRLTADPALLHSISPDDFEEFVCDRLDAMGFEPKRVGSINRKDGGIDVLFWPRSKAAFPILGAAQVKHHRDPRTTTGVNNVRDFAGALVGQPINAALLVTNTSFTADAKWFAQERARLVRLRDFEDMRRWIGGKFAHDDEWREIPRELTLAPGIVVKVGK